MVNACLIGVSGYATHACDRTINPLIQVRGTAGKVLWSHDAASIETSSESKQTFAKMGVGPLRGRMMSTFLRMAQGHAPFYCNLDVAAKQTIVISAMHRACEVHPVASVRTASGHGVMRTVIPGIEEAIETAFAKEALFHDIGVPWSHPWKSTQCHV